MPACFKTCAVFSVLAWHKSRRKAAKVASRFSSNSVTYPKVRIAAFSF